MCRECPQVSCSFRGFELDRPWSVPFLNAYQSLDRSRLLTGDRARGAEPRFLRGDQPEGGPVELAITTCDACDQPIPDHRNRRHWRAGFFGLCERQTHVLEY